jgi:trehalose/maltose transport system substrate-binding protein
MKVGVKPEALTALVALVCLSGLVGCGVTPASTMNEDRAALVVTGIDSGENAAFEQHFFENFGRQHNIGVKYLPILEAGDTRLAMYKSLLQAHSAKPDEFQVDVVWPPALASNLIDLTQYFQKDVPAFSPGVLESYTVNGRLVALPTFVDVGVLYYRPSLLRKYGYTHPPKTWKEMEEMATFIQDRERQAGNKDFWGYVWQGGPYEALTCVALEWQASSGAGDPIRPDGTINVRDPRFIKALERAAGWIGTISPPGEYAYLEQDSANIWDAGNTVFLRHWASIYAHLNKNPGNDKERFEVAPLPGGPGGQRGTLGGWGVGVSRYSSNTQLAVASLKALTSEEVQTQRTISAGDIPTREKLIENRDLMRDTSLHGPQSSQILAGLVSRPSKQAGAKYPEFSRAYYSAVNDVLRHRRPAAEAMEGLEAELTKIMNAERRR